MERKEIVDCDKSKRGFPEEIDIRVRKGKAVEDFYCPSGFRFLTNIEVDREDMTHLGVPLAEYINRIRDEHGGVAVADAFDIHGNHLSHEHHYLWYAIYVKE